MSEGEGGNERDGVQTDNDDVLSKGPDVLESLWSCGCCRRHSPARTGGSPPAQAVSKLPLWAVGYLALG